MKTVPAPDFEQHRNRRFRLSAPGRHIGRHIELQTRRSSSKQWVVGMRKQLPALPGIRDAAITSALPLEGWHTGMPFQIVGAPFRDRANRDACAFKMVSPSYFRSLGIRVERGRSLDERDTKNAPAGNSNQRNHGQALLQE